MVVGEKEKFREQEIKEKIWLCLPSIFWGAFRSSNRREAATFAKAMCVIYAVRRQLRKRMIRSQLFALHFLEFWPERIETTMHVCKRIWCSYLLSKIIRVIKVILNAARSLIKEAKILWYMQEPCDRACNIYLFLCCTLNNKNLGSYIFSRMQVLASFGNFWLIRGWISWFRSMFLGLISKFESNYCSLKKDPDFIKVDFIKSLSN